MLIYPVPHAVTQARVQLVADQTEKAPSHIIQADLLNVFAAKNAAERQALADLRDGQAKQTPIHQEPSHQEQVRQDQAQQSLTETKPPANLQVQQNTVEQDHIDVKA